MPPIEIKASVLYQKTRDAGTRVIVHEGGARSTKTYSCLQYFIVEAFESNTPRDYDIVRETFPALRATALKDFLEILQTYELFDDAAYNRSSHTYILNGSTFSFYSVDEAQKIRGRKRHKVLMNEGNEMDLETFRQLEMRTIEQIIIDYNPSDEEHWIYDKVIPRPDCTFIHSTFLDNPFLPKAIIDTIRNYEEDDPLYWKIYGLGLRGRREGLIFNNWDLVPSFPDDIDDILYGIDFGFNDPKVLVRLGRRGKDIYVEELFYKSEAMRDEFIEALKMNIPEERRSDEIFADCNDPESIAAIYASGFNIHGAEKPADSVISGIQDVMSYRLHITQSSVNVHKDVANYKWKQDKTGKWLDAPAHGFSHACDAIRYPVFTHWGLARTPITNKEMRQVEVKTLTSNNVIAGYL